MAYQVIHPVVLVLAWLPHDAYYIITGTFAKPSLQDFMKTKKRILAISAQDAHSLPDILTENNPVCTH